MTIKRIEPDRICTAFHKAVHIISDAFHPIMDKFDGLEMANFYTLVFIIVPKCYFTEFTDDFGILLAFTPPLVILMVAMLGCAVHRTMQPLFPSLMWFVFFSSINSAWLFWVRERIEPFRVKDVGFWLLMALYIEIESFTCYEWMVYSQRRRDTDAMLEKERMYSSKDRFTEMIIQ